MELSQLKFAVDTGQLKEAVDLLGQVQQKTNDLGKAQVQQEKSAKKAAKSQTEVSDALEDSEKKISPLEKLLQKLNNQYGDLVKGFTKGEAAILQQARTYGAAEDALQPFIAELEKIKELTKDPFDASVGAIRSVSAEFDRLSQRAELAQRGISLSTKQLSEYSRISAEVKGKVLELGMDPKSAAGVEKFNQLLAENRNEYLKVAAAANALEQAESLRNKTLRDNERLLAANLQAQTTMMNDAVKLYQNAEADKAKALAARMRMEATAGDNAVQLFYKNEQQKQKAFEARMKAEATMMDGAVIKYYTMLNKPSNNKTQIQSARDLAQATKWLATEESRMVSVLNTLNQVQDRNVEVSEKAARSVANYERNLAKAGITGEAAAAKLDVYRKQQLAIQSVEEKRQSQFLTRALQPQIGDVAISLAAGQNPLTVLLQQGDQIRGLIAQTGVQGEALRTVMRNAFTDTIKSVKDTAIAMGSVLGGAFIALGNNVMGLVTGPFAAFKASAEAGASAGTSLTAAVTALNAAFTRLVGNPIVALIVATGTALAALGIAFYQVSRQGDEMSKTLALNGGTLGLTRDSAISYAQSLNEVGVSTSKAVDVITAMSKAGGFVASDIEIVGKTAVMMQRDVGIAIEDTVKNFAKLKDKPVEAIIELAKATGMVAPAVIATVAELEKQGRQAEAVALAMKTSADVQVQQAARIKQEYSSLGTVIAWFGKTWTDMWDGIRETQYKSSAKEQLQNDLKEVQKEIDRVSGNLALTAKLGITTSTATLDALKATANEYSKRLLMLDKTAQAEMDLSASNAANAKIEEAKIKLSKDYSERESKILAEKFTRQEAINAAIEKETKLRKALGGVLTESEISTITKVTGAEYDKSKSKGVAAAAKKEQDELTKSIMLYNDVLNKSAGYNKEFDDSIRSLLVARNAGKKTQEEYYEAVNNLVKQQPFYIQMEREAAEATKKRADNQEWLNGLLDKAEGKGKEYSKGLKVIEELGLEGDEKQAALAALEKTTPAYKALDAVMANYGKTLADVNAQRTELQDSYSTDFMTDSEKAAYQSLSKFKRSQAEADAEYNKALADAKKYEDSEYYAMMESLAKDVADRRKATAQDVYDREKYLQSQTYQMYAAGFEALKGLSANFSTAVADQFINFAKTGKSSFEDLTSSFGNMVENMIYDLIRLQIQKQVAGLLDMGISAAAKYFGASTATTGSSQYALTSGGSGLASMGGGTGLTAPTMFAKGGVVDGLTMFSHSGGTGGMGEAGPEAIMPLKRDSSGSLGVAVTGGGSAGSNVEVVINNYGSDKATTTETTDSRGNRKINVTIGDVVSGEISRSGSAVQKSMQATYGQRPQLIRR